MSGQVIRQDVIEVIVESDLGGLTKLTSEMDKLKTSVTGDVNSGFEKLKSSVAGVGKGNSLDNLKNGLSNISSKLSDIAKNAAGKAYTALKKIAGISFKTLAAGLGAAATAAGAIVKQSVAAYADYEQLVGGVDTLFKDSSSIVQKNADNAFKTSGLSANQYMETVTSFSASLIQSLGGDTKKAADLADQALVDMSDKKSVRLKCIEPYQGCGAKRQQEMAA